MTIRLNELGIKLDDLKKKVFCKKHKLLLKRDYDGMTICPKDTKTCSACTIDELILYETLIELKMNRVENVHGKMRLEKWLYGGILLCGFIAVLSWGVAIIAQVLYY